MKIVNVIPIAKGIFKEHLSYFSSVAIPAGSVVSVPIRNRSVPAVVIENEDVTNLKTSLKSSPFSIKKIKSAKYSEFLSPEFTEACRETARYFATNTGNILNATIPKAILENIDDLKTPKEKPSRDKHFEKLVLQANDEERFANYKSIIREEFAKGYSVFICLPTLEETKKAKAELERGIEDYTYSVDGSQNKKDLIKTWNKIALEDHPVLVLTTGNALCFPREDLGTIIVEKESSRAYKKQTRPYLDLRTFAEILAKNKKVRVLFGDVFLRVETIWKQRQEEYIEHAPLKFRSLSSAECVLSDQNPPKDQSKQVWKVLGEDLKNLIHKNKENSENLFIFGARRGLSPMTVCGDCGTIVLCNICKAPITLHKSSKENFFLCHRCGEKRSAKEKCSHCTSWKLNVLGAGVEKIEEEIKEEFPEIKVFRIDKDSASTPKKAQTIAEKFYATPGSVLIGTEMALLYANKTVENTSLASIDSMFSIPDYRINEQIFHIILKMRELATGKFVVQTRMLENKMFEYALSGNLVDFYRQEIEERKAFNYPPFSVLIKITLEGTRNPVEKEMEKLSHLFKEENIGIFPAFTPEAKGKYAMHALIKVPQKEWVSEKILEKLLGLPPQFKINVDAESIL